MMAFCQYCGKEIPDDARFCPHCGATQNITQTDFQPNMNMNQTYGYGTYQVMPMKWYKFLIYFALIIGAVSYVFTGIQLLTGSHYEGMASYVYSAYSWMKFVDVVIGIGSIAIAALAVIARQKLANYQSDGPKFLLIYYGASVVLSVIYIFVISILIGDLGTNMATMIPSLAVSIIMIYINKVYFDKRKHLFVN